MVDAFKPFLERLQQALAYGKTAGAMSMDEEADCLWAEHYGCLKRSADDVPHTDRARPHVMRLAMLYALADGAQSYRLEASRSGVGGMGRLQGVGKPDLHPLHPLSRVEWVSLIPFGSAY